MKKLLFTLSLTLIPFYTFAYEGTISQSGSCGATDADCHYDLYDDGHLEISGTGEMTDWNYHEGHAAPWGPDNFQGTSTVTSVNIDGITKIGTWAFLWCRQLTDIKISDTVSHISGGAFEAINDIGTLVIPDGVEKIDAWSFYNNGAENIIIEGTPVIEENAFAQIGQSYNYENNTYAPKNIKIYCQTDADCESKGQGENVVTAQYDKEGGVYILDYGTENEKYYYSSTDMAGKTNECTKVLGECKRDVLEAKGICQGSACDTFIQSDGNYMLKYNGKTYQDINALLKGDYDRRRIYTIEEANFVAGDKNRVSIKYR